MGKRKSRTAGDAAFEAAAPPTAKTRLGPLDVQQKEFRVSRFGGYKMRDVDEFLDAITDSMSAAAAENDHLRKGVLAPVLGSPDLDDVSRQADEIIQRARTEATRIVAEAKAQGVGDASSPQDRAAVNAFLSKEREFLQSLAGLVQGHAETVKGMSKAVRKAPAPAAEAEATTVAPSQAPPTQPSAPSPAVQEQPPQPEPTAVQEAVKVEAEQPTQLPEADAAVRINEPEPAGVARGEGDDEGGAEGDRSLRDLFWGED
jgi:DivIVA domain-containing protein